MDTHARVIPPGRAHAITLRLTEAGDLALSCRCLNGQPIDIRPRWECRCFSDYDDSQTYCAFLRWQAWHEQTGVAP